MLNIKNGKNVMRSNNYKHYTRDIDEFVTSSRNLYHILKKKKTPFGYTYVLLINYQYF